MEPHPKDISPTWEVQQSFQGDQDHSLKQHIAAETHMRELMWLVVNYDPSTDRIAENFVINLYIYPELRM